MVEIRQCTTYCSYLLTYLCSCRLCIHVCSKWRWDRNLINGTCPIMKPISSYNRIMGWSNIRHILDQIKDWIKARSLAAAVLTFVTKSSKTWYEGTLTVFKEKMIQLQEPKQYIRYFSYANSVIVWRPLRILTVAISLVSRILTIDWGPISCLIFWI